MIQTLLLISLLLISSNAGLYHKHNHDISTGARCLDGSPSAIYVHEGAAKQNILVYFLGGGFCEGNNLSSLIDDCYKRSLNVLGSSYLLPKTVDFDALGLLSTMQGVNPVFWNWTKVFVHYCDGSFHEGSRAQPVNYKNTDLYFRGTNNTLQHFKYLEQNYNLYNANKVVITGQSAGGIATFLWTDYVYKRSANKNVYSIPDSGMFLIDYPNPKTGEALFPNRLKTLFNLINSEVDMPLTDCFQAIGDTYACMNFSNNVQYLKAPIFMIESAYDQYSVSRFVGQKCIKQASIHGQYSLDNCSENERQQINNYRTQTLRAINNFTTGLTKFGAWVPSCVQHTFSHYLDGWNGIDYNVPYESGVTIAHAVQKFLDNPDDKDGNTHIDKVQWPMNKGCSGHKNSLRRLKQNVRDLILKKLSSLQ